MKTREEFVKAAATNRKSNVRVGRFYVGGIFAFLGFILGLIVLMGRMGVPKNSPLFFIPIVLIFVGLYGPIFVVAKINRAKAKKVGVACPSCGIVLLRNDDIKLATATHNCPYCGRPVFTA